jgi:penicillin-binding protein-related factor A (putative recombinase)
MNENDVLQSICEYLWYNKIFFYRNNNTAMYDAKRGAYRAMPKWSIKGTSDIVGIYKGKPLYIEVKNNNPKTYPSKEQKEFIAEVIKQGGIAFVARSIEDVKNNL